MNEIHCSTHFVLRFIILFHVKEFVYMCLWVPCEHSGRGHGNPLNWSWTVVTATWVRELNPSPPQELQVPPLHVSLQSLKKEKAYHVNTVPSEGYSCY